MQMHLEGYGSHTSTIQAEPCLHVACFQNHVNDCILWSLTMNIYFQRLPVLHLRLVHLLLFYLHVIQGVIILSDTHQSRNVSAGTLVEFTCATPETGLTSFTLTPEITLGNTMEMMLPNGDRQLTLSFIAPSEYQKLTISCVATRENNINTSAAVLMIQGPLAAVGNLTSSEVDNCTLHFTWTAPYTLQGVPINYYTINITRHSNGTVLRSDTTNTTEYLYTVSSLGETLEVVVAAVNGAGTGNVSSMITKTPHSLSSVLASCSTAARKVYNWKFDILVEGTLCGNAVNSVTVKACDSSSCVDVPGIINISADGVMRVMATFTNLEENRKYSASVHVLYNGGVVQQSQPIVISTFDVHKANQSVINGQVCLDIEYVKGHEPDPESSVTFWCSKTGSYMHNATINGSSGCITVDPHLAYDVLITDKDAEDEIHTTAAVTITGVFVPNTTTPTPSVSSTESYYTPTARFHDMIPIIIAIMIALVIAFVVISAVIVIVLIFLMKKRNSYKTAAQGGKMNEHYIPDQGCGPEKRQSVNEQAVDDGHTDYLDQQNHHTNNQNPQSSQSTDQQEYASLEIVKQQVTPVPAFDKCVYSTVLMSQGEQMCIENLNKKKNLEPMPNHCTAYELLQPLSPLWYRLGNALGLAPYLDKVRTNNHNDSERLRAVLYHWETSREQVRPYTWGTLVAALGSNQVGATYFAAELSKKL